MNESDIEKKLRSISPMKPSRTLEERIHRDLSTGHPTSGVYLPANRSWVARVLVPFGWASAGAAVAIAIMLALDRDEGIVPTPHPRTAAGAIAAESSGNVQSEMLDVADEGILEDSARGPARVMRYTSLERRQWSEPGGAVTLVEVPREDVVLVPVSFQ